MSEPLPPWLSGAWERLAALAAAGRVPHALLVSGPRGIGKRLLAERFARLLLCESEQGRPCGHCRSCHLIEVGNHPDLYRIEPDPESKSGEIRIDAIRALREADTLVAQFGRHRIFLLDPADGINRAAANALLKTLEEPAGGSLLLLLATRPQALPATIRSRCQKLALAPADRDVARAWLTPRLTHGSAETLLGLAGGAPLRALELDQPELLARRHTLQHEWLALLAGTTEPIALIERWSAIDPGWLDDWMVGIVVDMLRLKFAPDRPTLFNKECRREIAQLAGHLAPNALFALWDRLMWLRRGAGTTLNRQHLLEQVLLACFEIARPTREERAVT